MSDMIRRHARLLALLGLGLVTAITTAACKKKGSKDDIVIPKGAAAGDEE